MSDIPSFPYRLMWEEGQLRSVANSPQDGLDFLREAARHNIVTHVRPYALRDANQALADLRAGAFSVAAVLVVESKQEAAF